MSAISLFSAYYCGTHISVIYLLSIKIFSAFHLTGDKYTNICGKIYSKQLLAKNNKVVFLIACQRNLHAVFVAKVYFRMMCFLGLSCKLSFKIATETLQQTFWMSV